jgi:hypothetical protein
MRVIDMAKQVSTDRLLMRLDRRFLEPSDCADADIADPDIDMPERIGL